jgi:hypothetical protein
MIQGREAYQRDLTYQMTTEAEAEKWLTREIGTCHENQNEMNKINIFSSRNLM